MYYVTRLPTIAKEPIQALTLRKHSASGVTLGISKAASSGSDVVSVSLILADSGTSLQGWGSCTISLLRGVSPPSPSSDPLFRVGARLGVSGIPEPRPCMPEQAIAQ